MFRRKLKPASSTIPIMLCPGGRLHAELVSGTDGVTVAVRVWVKDGDELLGTRSFTGLSPHQVGDLIWAFLTWLNRQVAP